MSSPLLSIAIGDEQDVVAARQRARQIAAALGFDLTEQTRIATAVSEIARNAYAYAAGGRVRFEIDGDQAPQLLTVRVSDTGPGIARLDDVLGGRYRSSTGLGVGLVGARRLMDVFDVDSSPRGTTVSLKKLLPARSALFGASDAARLAASLAAARPAGPLAEIREQNQELMRALDDLRQRQDDLQRVNRELEDTNRGVVALYAELDERADHLRRADELKTRFLSNMTHEFRTPVNSILALTALLAERLNADEAQKDELYYIRRAAQQLAELVDDLLDLAKVEAGKIDVHPSVFEVRDLFGALRGMLRPLLVNQSLALTFDEPAELPPICSDERMLSQILRNFISNSLKYTERGEVRVSACLTEAADEIAFAVSDTGIGIPSQDLERVFDEFVQIENPLQKRVKGTGLGLPLSKRLAELLGGRIVVESTLGSGSTFTVTIPLMHPDAMDTVPALDHHRQPVLVVEDAEVDLMTYQRIFAPTRFQIVPATSLGAATRLLEEVRPVAVVLDVRVKGDDSWAWLASLKRHQATAELPVIVVSTVDDRRKGMALGAAAYGIKPIDAPWLISTLESLVWSADAIRVLTIDDQDASRFIIRELLRGRDHQVFEATSGRDGLRQARRLSPDVILLDLGLGDMNGVDVCEALRRDATTSAVPIVVVTSKNITSAERECLGADTPILSKSVLTREALRDVVRRAVATSSPRRAGLELS